MQTLASYPRPRRKPSHKAVARGFTLLEILVVLTLVGLITAFSMPEFNVIHDRLAFRLDRDTFEQTLGGFAYQAFKDGRPIVLSGEYPKSANEVDKLDNGKKDELDYAFLPPGEVRAVIPINAQPATFPLPDTWRVTVEAPIIYQPSGFCDGGKVTLLIGQQRYDYDLKAPTCQPALGQ